MGGGLMQLVAYGAQDIYLTGNPQITFFKVVYRRHTNFATEYIQQTINGNSSSLGSRVTSTLSRSGDLVYDCYLESELDTVNVVSVSDNTLRDDTAIMNLGTAILDEVSVEIGGQQIDKQYGHSMEVWNQLTMKNTSVHNVVATVLTNYDTALHEAVNLEQQGQLSGGVVCTGGQGKALTGADYAGRGTIRLPLKFWFNKNPGLALPLIALQYHEVEMVIKTKTAVSPWDTTKLKSLKLWCNYVYLDTDERRRFAQVSHEYLIEQWQWQQNKSSTRVSLYFNHPVKELIWAGAPNTENPSTPTVLVDSSNETNLTLKLNGTERFAPQPITFFARNQVVSHHSGQGSRLGLLIDVGGTSFESRQNGPTICVYSFALRPEEHQPSGTCNFSRIDNAELVATGGGNVGSVGSSVVGDSFSTPTQQVNIYAINYNVLRIMSGMGGLAYSN